jgi:hypothetical protein
LIRCPALESSPWLTAIKTRAAQEQPPELGKRVRKRIARGIFLSETA